MPTPFYEAAGVTIYHGNAYPILMELPSESIDCTITDPPYSSGGMFRGDRTGTTTQKYVQSGQTLQHGDFSGDNRDQRASFFENDKEVAGFGITKESRIKYNRLRELWIHGNITQEQLANRIAKICE